MDLGEGDLFSRRLVMCDTVRRHCPDLCGCLLAPSGTGSLCRRSQQLAAEEERVWRKIGWECPVPGGWSVRVGV